MRRFLFLSVFMLLVLGVASFAQDAMDENLATKLNHAVKLTEMKDKLKLTDIQKTKLKRINIALGQKTKALIKQRNELTKDINEELNAGDPNIATLESKIQELEKVRTQIMLSRLAAAKDAMNVLTPEQKVKLKKKYTSPSEIAKEKMLK